MPRKEGIACSLCQDVMLGKTRAEAIEDAKAVGWESRQGQWVCDNCINEEEAMV